VIGEGHALRGIGLAHCSHLLMLLIGDRGLRNKFRLEDVLGSWVVSRLFVQSTFRESGACLISTGLTAELA